MNYKLNASLSVFEKKEFTKIRRKEIEQSVPEEKKVILCNPLRSIRKKCVDCSGSYENLTRCNCYSCPLWDFRFGTNPYKEENNMDE